jgi:hypothetical protein
MTEAKAKKVKKAKRTKKATAPKKVAKRAVKKTSTVGARSKAKTKAPNPMVQNIVPSGDSGFVSNHLLLEW